GYRLEEGLLYYLVHGVLHLVGYEHVGVPAARAAAMYARQEELFTRLLT
ncbi:MAG: rRNA maturation RNAse YbeY, partial [Deltaproteobacteria bacterium]|nr:rRNA maturation RNAse YbeY [Deltaproteobacteria bacterium]